MTPALLAFRERRAQLDSVGGGAGARAQLAACWRAKRQLSGIIHTLIVVCLAQTRLDLVELTHDRRGRDIDAERFFWRHWS